MNFAYIKQNMFMEWFKQPKKYLLVFLTIFISNFCFAMDGLIYSKPNEEITVKLENNNEIVFYRASEVLYTLRINETGNDIINSIAPVQKDNESNFYITYENTNTRVKTFDYYGLKIKHSDIPVYVLKVNPYTREVHWKTRMNRLEVKSGEETPYIGYHRKRGQQLPKIITKFHEIYPSNLTVGDKENTPNPQSSSKLIPASKENLGFKSNNPVFALKFLRFAWAPFSSGVGPFGGGGSGTIGRGEPVYHGVVLAAALNPYTGEILKDFKSGLFVRLTPEALDIIEKFPLENYKKWDEEKYNKTMEMQLLKYDPEKNN